MTGTDLLTAAALILVIEGAILAIFPAAPRRLYAWLKDLSPDRLRGYGVGVLAAGVFALWLLRG
ncbi:MAG: DUF2065 domain-containing protein [Rhodovibrionaceae bacterium]